ncbi:conserved oligomeric Golgi complex subunit 3 isoform X2 [Zootermopsis nevadensis]|uniref:conserved oligomeric Golgi complex subunit 3 isoform X2 n=1 Tax=Zootermopsis nevadensis TaxID=136037 RepID=UPI000B8E4826|nr:conserved oligomeric Golgi complex subunit 3 isoform X2 [Zootermopsis nevadensis]
MVAQCSESNKDTLTKYSAQQKIIWNICLGTKQIENGKKNNIKLPFGDDDEVTFNKDNEITCHDLAQSFVNLELGRVKIETTQQFLSWYSHVEEELLQAEDVRFTDYWHQLAEQRDECAVLLSQIESALKDLSCLMEQYQVVSNRTNSLHQVSEQLLADQTKLHNTCEEVGQRLQNFMTLDSLNNRLASPTLCVSSEAFVDILDRLDQCMEYIGAHSKWRESSSYLTRFRHCLSRIVAMIRGHVVDVLEHATQQVLAPATHVPMAAMHSTGFALCYGKFQASAARVKPLLTQVESRVTHSPEYQQLLTECHQCYFTQRELLLSSSVATSITELSVTHKGDHCSLVRSSCACLVHVCQDEYQLFYQFFSQPTPLLTSYLEGLCTVLYDVLRPFIIHINHLETLAEVCSILRLEMLEEHVQNNPGPLEAFGQVAWQLLQDVQERLVFRAHCYLQSDILHYKPAAGDLAYPEKLEMMESIAQSLQEQAALSLRHSESRSSLASIGSATSQEVARINSDSGVTFEQPRSRTGNSPADLHGMWYPTVRRTLVCLSRLYRCVDRPIFQGLSQEALTMCIQSVASAAQAICTKKSPIDGELFQIKHLLILREQIAPFQVDFTIKEMSLDFSKVKTAAFSLLHKRKQLFSLGTNNALLEFLLEGTPTVREQLVDSRKEVDKQLKASCEAFIHHTTKCLVGPLLTFLDKSEVFVSMQTEVAGNATLAQQPFAHADVIGHVVQETQRLIKSQLPTIHRSMQLYLANRETEFILFRPIKNNVVASFVQLQQVLSGGRYTSDDLLLAGCPSPEQVTVLLSSASLLSSNQEALPKVSNTTTTVIEEELHT